MGKSLIQQRKGKGSSTFRAPSFRYIGKARNKTFGKEGPGKIVDLINCPGHSAPLAVVEYEDKELTFEIAAEGIKVGQTINATEQKGGKTGDTLLLRDIPEGTEIYNIESKPGDGGKFVRAAGGFAKVVSRIGKRVTVLLPSKKRKEFLDSCRATIGIIAGSGRKERPFVKAGNKYHAMRAKNKMYPRTSGASMNVNSHPFGGTRSSRKGRPTIAPKHAPPGRKVGMIRPRRTGRRKK